MLFKLWGKVKKGQGRGKGLGFPTANITLHKEIPEGVYLSVVKIGKDKFNSLTFIGTVKTFNETKYHAESFILDFDENLYGRFISSTLIRKIRGNVKFKTAESLISQMKRDEIEARKYFSNAFDIDNGKVQVHINLSI